MTDHAAGRSQGVTPVGQQPDLQPPPGGFNTPPTSGQAKAPSTPLDEAVVAHRRRVEEAQDEALWPLARLIEWAIFDQAATWEESFDAGPGQVVSVSDAAMVAARFITRGAQ